MDAFRSAAWSVVVVGRVVRLVLDGPKGKLCLIAACLDPSSADQQVQAIIDIKKSVAEDAHNVIAGDVNFVENAAGRIAKKSAETGKSEDKRQADQWKQSMTISGFKEFEQSMYTCENSHGWSRIDRIYSDLHAANFVCSKSFCSVIGHRRHLSDHSPISFGIKNGRTNNKRAIPPWVALDENFEKEVEQNIVFLTRSYTDECGCIPNSFQQLDILKLAIRDATKYIQKKMAKAFATTNAHKLACTLGFVRAVEAGLTEQASRFQQKYERLQCALNVMCRTSTWYKQVKDHAVELMHNDIGERVRELRQTKANLPAEIYERRKHGISRQLKKLLPAGTNNEL